MASPEPNTEFYLELGMASPEPRPRNLMASPEPEFWGHHPNSGGHEFWGHHTEFYLELGMASPEPGSPNRGRSSGPRTTWLRSKHLATRGDLRRPRMYGLGAVLYALLTGKPPFQGESVLETLERVREGRPDPPSGVGNRVDKDLETICLKCLEKEPENVTTLPRSWRYEWSDGSTWSPDTLAQWVVRNRRGYGAVGNLC